MDLLGISWDSEGGSAKVSGMRDTELYERLLGVKEPWKVKAVKIGVEGRRVEVEVECAERTIWASPEGRQRLHIHGWETRSWRHLDTCGFATVIRAGSSPGQGRERTDRDGGGAVGGEVLPLYPRFRSLWGGGVASGAFAERCLRVAFHFLASGPSLLERAVARGLERRRLEELEAVGIDEKSFLSGQSYLSVLSDPKGSRVLEVTAGRERASA